VYLTSANPFGLTPPPKWFLKALAAYDADLVIFPSHRGPFFQLARKCRFSNGVQPADVPGVQNHPDTVFMCNRKLVPVTAIIPKTYWTLRVIEELSARDIWKKGGAKAFVNEIEANEEKQRAAIDRNLQTDLDARSSDAYKSFKYRTGQRVSLAHTGSANARKVKPLHFDRKPAAAPALSSNKPLVQLVAA
jgi:hypothetical protein